ncbi:uncharacterized protein [Diadema antillarum]|uniref:uncharacterized protein n=1 Tax=Diadema antillarum TaxID=105358 RepID=UPI003A845065
MADQQQPVQDKTDSDTQETIDKVENDGEVSEKDNGLDHKQKEATQENYMQGSSEGETKSAQPEPGGGSDVEMLEGDDDADSSDDDDIYHMLIAQDSDSEDDEAEDVTEMAESVDAPQQAPQAQDNSESTTADAAANANKGSKAREDRGDEFEVKVTQFVEEHSTGLEITHEPVTEPSLGEEKISCAEGRDAVGKAGDKSDVTEEDGCNTTEGALSRDALTSGTDHKEAISGSTGQAMPPTSEERETLASPSVTESSDSSTKLSPSLPSSGGQKLGGLPSSPSSSDLKPSTPSTLSSRSSTAESNDESSGRTDKEPGSSIIIRFMRTSTRERRESREQRERQEKLLKSEQSRQQSRNKSQQDIAQKRRGSQRTPHTEEKVTPPKTRGKMVRAGFEFVPGFKLEAMDYLNKWYLAKIVQVNEETSQILIHFEGWNSRYDEWVHYSTPKIRSVVRTSHRKDGFKEEPAGNYKSGDEVLARWSDCRYYPGKIVGINQNGSYRIIFYDGIEKNVQGMNVREMPEQLKQQDFFSNLQAQIERAQQNAARRSQNRQRLAERNAAQKQAAGSANTSPPEDRKRRLSSTSSSPAPGDRPKRARGSTEEVKPGHEGVKRSRGSSTGSRDDVKKSQGQEESKQPVTSAEVVSQWQDGAGKEKKPHVSLRGGVAKPTEVRRGHFLMGGGGGIKKKEERTSVRIGVSKPTPPAPTAPPIQPKETRSATAAAAATTKPGKTTTPTASTAPQAPPQQPKARPGKTATPTASTAPQAPPQQSKARPGKTATPTASTAPQAPTQQPRARPGPVCTGSGNCTVVQPPAGCRPPHRK